MKKLLIYYNFILVIIITAAGFLGATSVPQLTSAVLFFPLAVYFWLQVVPRKGRALPIPDRALVLTNVIRPKVKQKPAEPEEGTVEKGRPGFDIDRRAFVKLIGSAGLTLFFFAMFTKKAQGAFFGSVPGPGTVALKDTAGAQIDPAIKHPTDGYKIARLDDSAPAYYGFIRRDGAWFIMREESDGTYKYARGSSNFVTTGWDIHDTTLGYADFDTLVWP